MADNKAVARETLRRLYLFSRRVIKFCKYLNSEQIIRHLIIYTIGQKSYSIKELASLFNISHPWMSATVSKLEKKGIVTKKTNEDSRCRIVVLTPKGEKIRGDIKLRMDAHCEHAFENITEQEVELMGKLVMRINYDYDEPIVNKIV